MDVESLKMQSPTKIELKSANTQSAQAQESQAASKLPETSKVPEVNKPEDAKQDLEKELTEGQINDMLKKASEDANKQLAPSGRMLNYTVHEATKRVSIKVIDSKTQEVIREIPPEKELDAIAKMMELTGLWHDSKN